MCVTGALVCLHAATRRHCLLAWTLLAARYVYCAMVSLSLVRHLPRPGLYSAAHCSKQIFTAHIYLHLYRDICR